MTDKPASLQPKSGGNTPSQQQGDTSSGPKQQQGQQPIFKDWAAI